MKLKDLINYKEVDSDEIIFNSLAQSSDDEIINYIINVTSDLLNGVFLTDDFKTASRENLNKYEDIEIGQLATYMAITPFVQVALSKKYANWQDKATSFLESFIGYIIGTINKEDFLSNLLEMKEILSISNKFYNVLVKYFSEKKETIANEILNKLQF